MNKAAFFHSRTGFVNGIRCFGDIPATPGAPEAVQKMLYAALPLIGGYILMGTDALKEVSSD